MWLSREEKITKGQRGDNDQNKILGKKGGNNSRAQGGLAWAFIVAAIVRVKAETVEQRIHQIYSTPTTCQDCSKEIRASYFV